MLHAHAHALVTMLHAHALALVTMLHAHAHALVTMLHAHTRTGYPARTIYHARIEGHVARTGDQHTLGAMLHALVTMHAQYLRAHTDTARTGTGNHACTHTGARTEGHAHTKGPVAHTGDHAHTH
eukprot:390273-Pelagomonas_calceolata.AAC.7